MTRFHGLSKNVFDEAEEAQNRLENTSENNTTYLVDIDWLNVRRDADIISKAFNVLPKGHKVAPVREKRDKDGETWFLVDTDKGRGYVMKKFLKKEE